MDNISRMQIVVKDEEWKRVITKKDWSV
jgi:hypothetical protein